jgi:hypothetical protein
MGHFIISDNIQTIHNADDSNTTDPTNIIESDYDDKQISFDHLIK